jgi:hypothetical protein
MRAILFVLLVVLSSGCNYSKKQQKHSSIHKQTFKNQMELSISQVNTPSDTTLCYLLRIKPLNVSELEEMPLEKSQAMWYAADSCFYIKTRGQRLYPASIQPVSTGIPKVFDFIIEYENTTGMISKEAAFVFADLYFTKRKYTIQLL